ncbi:hypothetical protein, partial [Staphylococcus aureus]|uniref:hypothetical protein n=1 Tax=Staphylococcus aureus TaxID=1280 RepID=UPI0021AE7FC1
MKILVLAALIAAASSGRLSSQSVDHQTQGPWRPGTLYKYDVVSYTLATLTDESSGSAFKARFVVRAQDPGRLIARLENPQHAQIHQKLPVNRQLPADLKYEPVSKLDQPFEITINGGRVVFLNLPVAVQLAEENILKALISALQLDLTSHRHVPRDENAFDEQTQQGMFKKMETDVTGDCETMYNVYPAIPEWRRELPNFANDEEPIMISKTKNYGHCHHRVDYHFGVPQGAEWAGTAHRKHEDQFIRRATVSRMLAGKQGPIYKTETTSTVHVNPQVYGKEKAEVLSHVQMNLVSYEKDDQPEWQRPENNRRVNNLLYAITRKQVEPRASGEAWDSNEANNQNEHRSDSQPPQDRQDKKRMRRSAKISQDYQTARLSHSSSESESASTFVNDDLPKNNEPAYAAMYMAPQVNTEDKQNPINAQRVTQEMAQLLQNPNNMPKGDFLSKFNYLVRIISSMNSAQLNTVSRSIEVAKSSPNKVKADMFMIYRDAVAQAG